MTKNITVTGFQVRPDYLTGVCGVCGALLGDIDKHDEWHAPQDEFGALHKGGLSDG